VLKYREYTPHPSLRRHVKCFWVMEREYTPESPTEDVTPDAFIELILNFGAPYVLHEDGRPAREMPAAILVGLQNKPLLFRCSGTVKLIATRFFAWGAVPFLADEQRGAVRLRTTLGREWTDLAAKVQPAVRAGDDEGAVSIVQDHLIERLLVATVDVERIRAAAQLLHLRKGQAKLAELAEHCGLSGRQLQRKFRSVLGATPKALARAIRFEEIRRRLMFDPDGSLTSIAHEFGYADQAHFVHDFKKLADRTPGEFVKQMQAIQSVFRDQDNVVFLQAPESVRR
jgi:AraC-like DNA-binding protein